MVHYRDAISDPSKVVEFLEWRHRHTTRYLLHSIQSGRYVDALWLLPSYLDDGNHFTRYLYRKSSDGYLTVNCDGFDFRILPNDVGIGREIYFTGSHEPRTTAAYQKELRKACDETNSVTILEIGANAGYFVLEALTQCPDATVYAVEPLGENVRLLEENLEWNGYSEQVTITRGAISTANGKVPIHLSESSNHASVNNKGEPTRKTREVQSWTIESYLNDQGLEPNQLNAIRMDIEGHEAGLFRSGFGQVLANTTPPFILNIEVHPKYMSEKDMKTIFSVLEEKFEFVAGYQHEINGDLIAKIDQLEQMITDDLPYIELILRRSVD